MIKDTYLNYVPSKYVTKYTYMNVLNIFIQPQIDINDLLNLITSKLYLNNTNAYTLNLLGEIFNVSRFVTPPIYLPTFSWNINGLGWNQIEWGKTDKQETLVDDTLYKYLVVFRTKLMLWDGSIGMLLACLEESFPTVDFTIIDELNMTIKIYCKFRDDTLIPIKQLLLNGALQLFITGVNINWEENNE